MKLVWLTDVHLNQFFYEKRLEFYRAINSLAIDAVLITGDIAEATSLREILLELYQNIQKKVYFVLGNHDYYYSSFAAVREILAKFCQDHLTLIWLDQQIVRLTSATTLVGVGGWYDGRYGDYQQSTFPNYDKYHIRDLKQVSVEKNWQINRDFADQQAKLLAKHLQQAVRQHPKKIMIATHVPPFDQQYWRVGRLTSSDYLPYFSSKATTDVLSSFSKQYPKISFHVVAGHVHQPATAKIFDNLSVAVGCATFITPDNADIIHVN